MKKRAMAMALVLTGTLSAGSVCMASGVDEEAAAAYEAVNEKYEDVTSIDMTAESTTAMTFENPIEGLDDMETNTEIGIKMINIDDPSSMQMEMRMTLPVTMTGAEDDMDIVYYYTDGYYYMDLAGQKVKYAMGLDELMQSVESTAGMENLDAELMSELTMEETDEGTLFTYSGNAESLGDYMDTLLGGTLSSMAGSFGTEVDELLSSLEFGGISGTVLVDDEQNIVRVTSNVAFTMTIEDMVMHVEQITNGDINAIGDDVTIELPNLDEFEEMDLSGQTEAQ